MSTKSKRPRANATGNVFPSAQGRLVLRVSIGDGRRPGRVLPADMTREEAEVRKQLAAELVNELIAAGKTEFAETAIDQVAKAPAEKLERIKATVRGICSGDLAKKSAPAQKLGGVTFEDVAKAWTSGELAKQFPEHVRGLRDMATNKGRLESYVLPVVRDVPIASFTVEHAKEVMAKLPPEWRVNTRRHIAQLLHRVLSLAVWPLEAIKANPLPKGFLPKRQKGRIGAFLYPDEEAQLLGCEAVPLQFRVLYAFINREGMRKEEAAGLEWKDLDFRHGRIVLDRNKTNDPRDPWLMNRGVSAALQAWKKRCTSTRFVFPSGRADDKPMNVNHLPDHLREHLRFAGVDPAQHFEDNDVRRHIVAHDLRATFVTVHLAEGRSERWIRARTGHRGTSMIETYRRAADNLAEGEAVALAPMDVAIPELAGDLAIAAAEPGNGGVREASEPKARSPKKRRDSKELCDGRDLNPHAFRRWNLKARDLRRALADAAFPAVSGVRSPAFAPPADGSLTGPPSGPSAASSGIASTIGTRRAASPSPSSATRRWYLASMSLVVCPVRRLIQASFLPCAIAVVTATPRRSWTTMLRRCLLFSNSSARATPTAARCTRRSSARCSTFIVPMERSRFRPRLRRPSSVTSSAGNTNRDSGASLRHRLSASSTSAASFQSRASSVLFLSRNRCPRSRSTHEVEPVFALRSPHSRRAASSFRMPSRASRPYSTRAFRGTTTAPAASRPRRRRASSSGNRNPFARAGPSFGRNPRGSGLAGMMRAGNAARASTRCMHCATCRRLELESDDGTRRMTSSAWSSVIAVIGSGPITGLM
ncbi:MAG: site-specific integrase [Deltaproteobacteria bacterium]|nr:site-specific integrase [Deltaproteobacteria bacterium]